MCKKYAVEHSSTVRDPDDPNHVLLLGENVENIPEEEIVSVTSGTSFTVTRQTTEDLLLTEMLSLTFALSLEKKEWENERWGRVEGASTQLLVQAKERSKERPKPTGSAFIVGPAHMVLRDEVARTVYAQVNKSADVRIEVESRTTCSRYAIQVREMNNGFDLKHPILFSYRYWCSTANNPNCPSCRQLASNPSEAVKFCQHILLNDIVFLPLKKSTARELHERLRHELNHNFGPMVDVDTIRRLKVLSINLLPIAIGGAEGNLIPIMDKADEHSFVGYHFQFTLSSTDPATGSTQLV